MKFEVTLDVTLSGDIEIEAESEKEAKEIIKNMNFSTLDRLRGFHFSSKDVFEVRQV